MEQREDSTKAQHAGGQQGQSRLSRRHFLEKGSAVLALTASLPIVAAAQQTRDMSGDNHKSANEAQPGPINKVLDEANLDSAYPPTTDAGGQPPFKYPFSLSHKRIEAGGWTRQVTVRDFPISRKVAGVEMRLIAGGIRELHWHVGSEWAFMTAGSARITAVNQNGRGFVDDVNVGDVWLFPGGIPHSIQGLGPDGCQFILIFDDGNFNEFQTFLLTDWLHHTPKEVLAKNFNTPATTFDNVPARELFIFPRDLPRFSPKSRKKCIWDLGRCRTRLLFLPARCSPAK